MSQTNQTIANFYNVAQNREFSRDFLFRVLNINFSGGAAFGEDELVYAKTAILPARDITNVNAPFMGLKFNVAGAAVYPGSDDYTIKFYCDASSLIRNKFLQETRRVFDDATSTGDYNIAGRGNSITLVQLNKNLEPETTIKLVGASIRSVGSIGYSMAEGTGAVMDFDVKMSYHFFEENAPIA